MTETKRPVSPGAEELIGKYFPVFGKDSGCYIELQDYIGTDESIESAARLSYSGGGTRKTTETRGLIRYLRNHRHTSPTEMCELRFKICMPIFVMRQWVRHRTANLNEISGRYSLLPMMFYTPSSENFKKQSKSNKQGREDLVEFEKYQVAVERWNKLREQSVSLYEDLIGDEIANEIARIDLPLSTMTQVVWKIDLSNLFHFLSLRTDSHAQYEIREPANVILAIVKKCFPISYEAFMDYEKCGKHFSRMELLALNDMLAGGKYHANKSLPSEAEYKTYGSQYGMTVREVKEFFEKLNPSEVPNYELDLSTAQTAEYYENLLNSKVPKIDLK